MEQKLTICVELKYKKIMLQLFWFYNHIAQCGKIEIQSVFSFTLTL